ncbi:MAG TPA: tetratricopeptide repeat protein [Terriglobia bacterium]|jgi:tetratricopeptide (TPR) repeat protein
MMKKLAFIGGALLIVILAAGAAWHYFWPSPQTYFNKGKQYYDQKKYPEATIEFLNALAGDQANRDARYYLGLSYLSLHDPQRAAVQFKTLHESFPNDDEASLQLGNIYLASGVFRSDGYNQARQIAEKLLAKNPQNVDALILSGSASEGLKNYSAAVLMFERAINIDPKKVYAFIRLGSVRMAQNRYSDAEENLLRAREIEPTDKGTIGALVAFYSATNDVKKTETYIKEGLELDATDGDFLRLAVRFYDALGRLEDVEKILKEVQEKTSDPAPSLLLADIYETKKRPSDALKTLTDAQQKFPKNADVAGKRAVILMSTQPDEARKEIDRLIKAEPQNPLGHVLLGELQYTAGQYDAAEATLSVNPALDSPYPGPHYWLGEIARRKGNTEEAISHFQKSAAVNHLGYVPARIALAEIFLERGKADDAREEIGKALQTDPDNVRARLFIVSLGIIEKKFPEAEQQLTALEKAQPQNSDVIRERALFEASRGRGADAQKNLEHALELQPASLEYLRELTALDVENKQVDKAIQRINAIADNDKGAPHYELLGSLYLLAGKSRDAEDAYKKAIEKDPSRIGPDFSLFKMYAKTGRAADSIKVLDDVLKKHPTASAAYILKAIVYEAQGQRDQAVQGYNEALKVQPDSDVAANNLAYLLAEEGRDLPTALQKAELARKLRPDDPFYADTTGWVYYKMGDYSNAREQFLFAVSKQGDNGTFLYHLAKTYEASYQIEDAARTMKKAVSSSGNFPEKALAQAAVKELSR